MDHLAFVDLSFNRLTGTVPSAIAEKYKLEVNYRNPNWTGPDPYSWTVGDLTSP